MVGKKIKNLVENSGFTIEDIASKLKVTKQSVYNWYKKDSIDSKYLSGLSIIFDIPINYFFETDSNLPLKSKPLDKGKFGGEVEEELRAQICKLEKDKEYLQRILETTLTGIAAELGKEDGTETTRLFLVPKKEEKEAENLAA